MNFIEKIIDGFNKVLSFLGSLFVGLFDLLSGGFMALIDLLAKPLSLLLALLEGLFYFFGQLILIVWAVVKIVIAIFQFMGALILGVFRTIRMWLTVKVTPDTNFPSATHEGFATVIDLLMPTGVMTVVPIVAIAFLWFYFALKMIGLFGGQIYIAPFSSKGGK